MEIETKTEELQNTNVEEKTSTVETTTTENVVEEPKPIKYFKSFEKEEDWTSYHDSIVNKANTELLKEFGVSSTKELKAKLEAYETSSASMKAELEQIKQEIDKKVQQGADAQELKDTITLASENDEEAKQAKDYAVNKLKTTAKVENLKDKLLKTSKTATFKDLNIRG